MPACLSIPAHPARRTPLCAPVSAQDSVAGHNVPSGLLQVRTWGTRGSLPVSGPEFVEFGGSTTCIEVRCGDEVLLFDAGSGMLPAGRALKARGVKKTHLLFTHCHYDHIIGFPYFGGLFDATATVHIWSGHMSPMTTTAEMIHAFMHPPFFPIDPGLCPAHIQCHDFTPGDILKPEPEITLHTGRLVHPGGAVGYRIDWNGRSVAIITDTEHQAPDLDPVVLDLIRDVDLFVYDACYTEPEMALFRGFGHSTWQQALLLAQAAGVGRVALSHHAPWRSDSDLKAMQAEAQATLPGAFFARDGQTTVI